MIATAGVLLLVGSRDFLTPILPEKYAALQAQSHRINTLFIGPSRTYRSFDPAIIDSILNTNGIPIRSFNLGKAAMTPLEANMMVDRVLQMKLPNLKLIVFELEGFESEVVLNLVRKNQGASRIISFHDLKRTWLGCQVVWAMERPLAEKIAALSEKLLLLLKHLSLAGKGDELILGAQKQKPGIRPEKTRNPLTFNGFVALDEEIEERYKFRYKHFLGKRGQKLFKTHLALMRTNHNNIDIRQQDWVSAEIFRQMAEKCAAEGIRVIFLFPPIGLGLQPLATALQTQDANTPIIRLSSMEKYPAFYRVENRFDRHHLNHKGAKIASREMAAALLKFRSILEILNRS